MGTDWSIDSEAGNVTSRWIEHDQLPALDLPVDFGPEKNELSAFVGVKWAMTSCNFIRFCSWRTHSSKISFLTFLCKVETTRNSKTSESALDPRIRRPQGQRSLAEMMCSSPPSVFPVAGRYASIPGRRVNQVQSCTVGTNDCPTATRSLWFN